MKKNKLLQRMTKTFIGVFALFAIVLIIYSFDYYRVNEEMYLEVQYVDVSNIEVNEDNDQISYTVAHPQNNIIIIPGGKVDSYAYEYLAYNLALEGNNVTIYKPYLHLAIIFPNHASRFVDENLNNVIIGHSLGGVVASIIASNNEEITEVVLMASYSTNDLTEKDVLLLTGEYDNVMLEEEYEESKSNYDNYSEFMIEGGNHAQFGWYGEQADDGEATITTKQQQDIVIEKIIEFIN